MSELNRRGFVMGAASLCAACAMQLPSVAIAAEKVEPVDAGPLSDFGKEGIYDQFVESHRFVLVCRGDRLYAMSALCTHKKALIAVASEGKKELSCAKHGSQFNNEGVVLKGPAKLALPRYGISLNSQQHVMVNPAKQYEEKQWKDAGSSIKVAKSAE